MRRAVASLTPPPDALLIDAVQLSALPIAQRSLIHGDRRCLSIAAASILAKVFRDEMMRDFHEAFPSYGFDRNKGYPTAEHRRVIALRGPSPLHRQTFAPIQQSLFLEGR
jgi:ribonuclease HII